jgi:hypothetical protein
MDPSRPELVEDDTIEPLSARGMRPVVLLALADHSRCSALRADLIERGRDAACVGSVAAAVVLSAPTLLARASVFVVEEATLSALDRAALAWIRALDPLRAGVLITSAATRADRRGRRLRCRRGARRSRGSDGCDGAPRGTCGTARLRASRRVSVADDPMHAMLRRPALRGAA